MKTCKFCGVTEGTPDRRGDAAHINRDSLCAACNYVIEKVRRQPERVTPDERDWYNEACRFNEKHSLYVPRMYAPKGAVRVWTCRRCGTRNNQDDNYKCYCHECAREVRREAATRRKTRSDKGTKRARVTRKGWVH